MARILIADDSIIMRRNLKSILTRLGHSIVAEATNGEQACNLYNKDEVDIVTLDITMPVMDGIEALKNILSYDPNANVVIISALDQKRMIFHALELGVKYYIIKPVTEEKIVNAINKILTINETNSIQENDLIINQDESNIDETNAVKNFEESQSVLPPFSIDNINGEFVININSTLNSSNIGTLLSTLQGFLFIRPLKVTFKFNSTENLDISAMNSLIQFSKKIEQAEGEFKVDGNTRVQQLFYS